MHAQTVCDDRFKRFSLVFHLMSGCALKSGVSNSILADEPARIYKCSPGAGFGKYLAELAGRHELQHLFSMGHRRFGHYH